MKQSIAGKSRKELENKLAKVFEMEMRALPGEFRMIIADDLVSAFENRLYALNRAQSNLKLVVIEERELHVKTV